MIETRKSITEGTITQPPIFPKQYIPPLPNLTTKELKPQKELSSNPSPQRPGSVTNPIQGPFKRGGLNLRTITLCHSPQRIGFQIKPSQQFCSKGLIIQHIFQTQKMILTLHYPQTQYHFKKCKVSIQIDKGLLITEQKKRVSSTN